jgi:hypothetical protein
VDRAAHGWRLPVDVHPDHRALPSPLHRDAPGFEEQIREEREAVFTPRYIHLVEAQWRHLTDRTAQIRRGHPELPCAGTVAVRLGFDETIRILPSAEAHNILIDRWLQPLCRAPGAAARPLDER